MDRKQFNETLRTLEARLDVLTDQYDAALETYNQAVLVGDVVFASAARDLVNEIWEQGVEVEDRVIAMRNQRPSATVCSGGSGWRKPPIERTERRTMRNTRFAVVFGPAPHYEVGIWDEGECIAIEWYFDRDEAKARRAALGHGFVSDFIERRRRAGHTEWNHDEEYGFEWRLNA